jgi:hypothetical protein
LQPTILIIWGKVKCFDYFISYNISSAKNQVINRVTLDNNVVINTNENIPEVKIHNFSLGMPIPYMLFKRTDRNFGKWMNPDTMNFLYVYYQYHQIKCRNQCFFWLISCLKLYCQQNKFALIIYYSKRNYFYFIAEPIRKPGSYFSKKILKDQLTLSVYADDIWIEMHLIPMKRLA